MYASGGIYYDDPGALVNDAEMRVSAGLLVQAKNSTCEAFFKSKGYKVVELPKATAVYARHPMRMINGIQFFIAVRRAYPKIFDFF